MKSSYFRERAFPILGLLGALLAAGTWKAWLLSLDVIPFNSDEAVVALMGRHILAGERPVFFYGQAYMGSLDAWLAAAGFSVFGQQVWVIRLVQTLLYLGVLGTTARLGKEIFRSWRAGILAAWLLAIPTVNVTLYTTVSLGGYGEALLLGNLTLLLSLAMQRRITAGRWERMGLWWFGWGLAGGLGLWAFGLALVYTIPAGLWLFYWTLRRVQQNHEERQAALLAIGAGLLGGLAGAGPWWGYALQNGPGRLIYELSGGAIAGVEQLSWAAQALRHLGSFLLLGITVIFGLRPPWSADWLALPLLPLALGFWAAALYWMTRRLGNKSTIRPEMVLLAGTGATLLVVYVLTPFGADPSGRYFVPLAIPLALIAADLVTGLAQRTGRAAWGLALLVVAFNAWGTIQAARTYPPGITTQFYAPAQVDRRYDEELIAFLREQGETRGYGNYWVTYPLAFLSGEELIFTPRLPYHLDFRYTARDDRYPPYDREVEAAKRAAYITTNHPELDAYLRGQFKRLGVGWQEAQIGDYHVFYDLSELVRPEDIGLGKTVAEPRRLDASGKLRSQE